MVYLSQRKLGELKQAGTTYGYVKRFLGSMLDIKDMSEEDKFLYFLEGLKPWARTKLQRQRVQDLATTQTAVEHLTDYATETTQPKKVQPIAPVNTSSGKQHWKPGRTKSGGADEKPIKSNLSSKSARSMSTKSNPMPTQVQAECPSRLTSSRGARWGR